MDESQASAPDLSTILHVDMDAFYASVAELDYPEYKGRPLVVGAGPRGVVLSANYKAREFGIRAAMPVGRAQAMAPSAVFIPPEHHRYSEISERVMQIFQNYTPHVEPISLDEAFLDVTGSKKLMGTGREIAELIRATVRSQEGITCSVGIAPSKFIAKLASQHCKPDGLLEITSKGILTFLHPLPVGALWGVGPKTNEVLTRLGLITVADIAHTPRSSLVKALGAAAGQSLFELAWGRDYRPVISHEEEKSMSAAETFAEDLDSAEEILQEYLRLTEKVSSRLREKSLHAKTISIKVRYADFSTISRSKTLPVALDSAQEIYAVVKALFEGSDIQGARIRMVSVGLESLQQERVEQLTLGAREFGWPAAQGAIDKARARFGSQSVGPASLIESESQSAEPTELSKPSRSPDGI